MARSHQEKVRNSTLLELFASTRSLLRRFRRGSQVPLSRLSPALVQPWHTHPLGQTLIVTAGFGRVQREGGSIEEIRPGDVAWFPPGEKHWHGASPTTAMTHIAIQESLGGRVVDWMEKVTDAQYTQPR